MKTCFFLFLFLGICGNAFAQTCTWIGDGTNTNWSTANSWHGSVTDHTKPVAGDDVVFNAGSANCTLDESTAVLNSLDMTGYANTLSGSGATSFTVKATSGTQVCKFAGTVTWAGTVGLTVAAANGATLNVTWPSGTWNTAIQTGSNVGGTWNGSVFFLNGLTLNSTKTLSHLIGTLHTDGSDDAQGLTHSWGYFSSTNANTRTLTMGDSTINLTSTMTNGSWNTFTVGGLTVSNNTATVNLTGNGSGFTSGTKNYNGLTLNYTGSGSAYHAGNITVANFSRIGTASKADSMNLTSSFTATASFTITGNSVTNRLLVYSSLLGTARTLTLSGATVDCDNVDFRDITFTNGNDIDLTAGGTKSIGDCGGNSNGTAGKTLTMTSATTQTYTDDGNSDNWNLSGGHGAWTSRVPLPQDTVVISGTAGQTLTVNMPRIGKDISFTTATKLTLGNNVTSYGSVNMTGMGTFAGSFSWTFESGARNLNHTLTSSGKSFVSPTFNCAGTAQMTLSDAFSSSAAVTFSDTNTLNMGSFTHTLSRASSNVWIGSGTINAETSTISITNTGTSAKTFAGGTKTYYNLTTPSGTGGVTISGSNIFNSITVAAAGKLTLTAATTQTIRDTFSATGTVGNVITLTSSTAAAAYLNKTGTAVNCEWISVTAVAVTPATLKWYYGTNGVINDPLVSTGWNAGVGGTYLKQCTLRNATIM